MRLFRVLLWSFLALTAAFYGIITAGQVLGLLKIYHLGLAVAASLLCAGAMFAFLSSGSRWFGFLQSPEGQSHLQAVLEQALGWIGLFLFALLALYPLVRWPFSPISKELNWDAGLYHFPKAVEMLVTGSAWDMTIDYGEYPFGYESLLALAFGLNPHGYLIGLTHALIALYFVLAWWLGMVRFSPLPPGLALFVVVLLSLSRLYLPGNENNLWWPVWPQVILIGKNDLFLGALLLAVALFTPGKDENPRAALPGLAAVSMMALSVKPNAVLLVGFAWGMAWWVQRRAEGWKAALGTQLRYALLVLPGVLWVVRNLAAMGSLFKPSAARLSAWSIAANLNNPYFYEHIPAQFFLVLGIVLLSGLIALFWRSIRLPVGVGLILLLSFVLTPASAFLGSNQQPAQIAWRFAIPLLAWQAVLLFLLPGTFVRAVYAWLASRWMFAALMFVLAAGVSAYGVWKNQRLMAFRPGGEAVLRDPFEQAVGVNGYFSAYDYVQKNVHHAVVIVENGLPFYLYDRPFTNSVTRARDADYFVAFRTAWRNGQAEGYPEMLSHPEFARHWELVYEDAEGRVYQRKP